MNDRQNRRDLLKCLGLAGTGLALSQSARATPTPPTAPVAIARCPTY